MEKLSAFELMSIAFDMVKSAESDILYSNQKISDDVSDDLVEYYKDMISKDKATIQIAKIAIKELSKNI